MKVSNNSRIAKNSLYMYIRTIFVLLVSLYASRIVLDVLGFEDFGVYNVIAGIVIVFSFLNNAMASTSQRFLSFEMGIENSEKLSETFNTILIIHLSIAVIVLVLAETLGLWFVNTMLNFPTNRSTSINWLYQLTILTFIISIIQVPFRAVIISHENFKFYSLGNIIEVTLKLVIVFLLKLFNDDKLIVYGVLVLCVSIISLIIYFMHCKFSYKETTLNFKYNRATFLTLTSYTSWNLFGNLSYVGSTQGINILLNLFFGPLLNAAMAIAMQVQSAVNSFVTNIQMTINPQIVKSYASGNFGYMQKLIYVSSKFSFFLLLLICFPIILETEYVLNLWLKEVPEYTVIFSRLILINLLVDGISGSLMTAIQATGKIKLYQTIVGSLLLLNLPISYTFLKFGALPETVQIITISLSSIALILRLFLLKRVFKFSILSFLKEVIVRIIIVSVIACIPIYFIQNFDSGLFKLLITIFIEFITIIFSILIFGLTKFERKIIIDKIRGGIYYIKTK